MYSTATDSEGSREREVNHGRKRKYSGKVHLFLLLVMYDVVSPKKQNAKERVGSQTQKPTLTYMAADYILFALVHINKAELSFPIRKEKWVGLRVTETVPCRVFTEHCKVCVCACTRGGVDGVQRWIKCGPGPQRAHTVGEKTRHILK